MYSDDHYQSYDDSGGEPHYPEHTPTGGTSEPNGMATAALILGIFSLVTCSAFYIAIPCGALAVLCWLLSRTGRLTARKGRSGAICGIIGIVLSAAITGYAVYQVATTPRLKAYFRQYLESYMEQLGLDWEDVPYLEEWLGGKDSGGGTEEPGRDTEDPYGGILDDLLPGKDTEDGGSLDDLLPGENEGGGSLDDLLPDQDNGNRSPDYPIPGNGSDDFYYGTPSQPSQNAGGGEFI